MGPPSSHCSQAKLTGLYGQAPPPHHFDFYCARVYLPLLPQQSGVGGGKGGVSLPLEQDVVVP